MRKLATAVAVVSLVGALLAASGGVAQADPPPVSFGPPTDFATDAAPASVAMGDLNGDSLLDLAVVNYSSSTVSVLLGTGAGAFGAATQYPTGTDPYGVALGDLNGDTRLDLVVTNYISDSVSVRLGNGSGGFGAKSDFAAGDGPYSVAVGDLDGDTFADLAVASSGSNNVSVLFGNGAGGFGGKTDFATGAGAASVAVADLNGDVALDLVVANYGDDNVSVLLGDGAGGFGPKNDFTTGVGPYSIALGDLNGDTLVDLVATSYVSNNVSVRLGNGFGGFGARTDHPTGSGAIFVALGDLNTDTFLDLAVANFVSNSVSVLLGDGTGGFAPKTDLPLAEARSVAVGDLDGNALPDLVVANYYTASSVSVLLNAGPACPVLTASPHTALSLSDGYRAGSVATFVADPGFELVGPATLTCQVGYTWDGSVPTAASTGAIAVAPGTGLRGGDELEVQLSGFAPFADLTWAQCLDGDLVSTSSCASPSGQGEADANGSLTVMSRVDRFIYVPSADRWIDCADSFERCAIGAADVSDVPATGVLASSGFAAAPAPPVARGTITVSPPGPVPGPGSVLSVTGSGFRSDAVVDLHQCVADPDHPSDCNRRAGSAVTDGTGAFTATMTVVANVTPPGGSTTQCFSASGACAVAAAEAVDFPGTVTAQPIAVPPRVVPGPVAIRLEGDAGTRVVNVKVGLSAPSTQTVTVDWATFYRSALPFPSAEPGVDYAAASGTVTFTPGQTAQTVPITINGDTDYEPNELVSVQFANPTNATLTAGLFGAIGWGNIANDDPVPPPPPTVVPGPVAIRLEGDAGTRVVNVKVGLSAPSTQTVTVDWATFYSSAWPFAVAEPGVDYVAASGTVTFAPGQTAQTVPITINGDTTVEPNEAVVMRFMNPTNAILGAGIGQLGWGNIANDD